ncbi:MAG: hypothetical protein DHS20C05_06610 [Hyphococcus sp.]|nr:MAG: hypothetical protein DHS20C05_06610 [Marinicaulis sp.]
MRAIEGVGLSAIGLPLRKNAISDTFKGTLLGAIPVSLMMIYALLSGYGAISFNGIEVKALLSAVAPLLLAGFLLAAWEELTLRGYLLRQLSISLTPLGAALITGIIFGLLHSGNPGANWEGVLYTAAGGMLMALLMFRTGSLWLLIGYHFGWNTTGSVIFGLDLSGFSESSTIFNSTLTGEDWLTGGNYGFEASLPIVVAEVVVLGAACLFCNRSSKPADFIPQ